MFEFRVRWLKFLYMIVVTFQNSRNKTENNEVENVFRDSVLEEEIGGERSEDDDIVEDDEDFQTNIRKSPL
jgi:hypothetical protein